MSKIIQVLGAFEFSLVKFDVGYPTGEKHKGFGKFGLQSVGLSNLLAAEVQSCSFTPSPMSVKHCLS